MRNFILIPALFFLVSNWTIAQTNDDFVKEIRSHYKEIRQNLADYTKRELPLPDESTEGGQTTAFYDKEELKLLEIVWNGETGKSLLEYYFHDGELIFAFDQTCSYNRPIYWDKKTAKENKDSEYYDPKKTKIKEERYYFKNEKLFLWLDKNKKEVDLTMGTNSIEGQGLVAHCYKVKGELEEE